MADVTAADREQAHRVVEEFFGIKLGVAWGDSRLTTCIASALAAARENAIESCLDVLSEVARDNPRLREAMLIGAAALSALLPKEANHE